MMAEGMKNGETLRGPPLSSASCSRSMVMNPPMPEPMKTPMSGAFVRGDRRAPQSSIANCEAAMAYWMKRSIFLISFFSMNCSGSNPLTSAAICVAYAGDVEPRDAGDAALSRAAAPPRSRLVPMPSADTSPMPVTTTRLFKILRWVSARYFLLFACASM